MKSRFYITGLIFISLLFYSCSNDDEFIIPEATKIRITSDINLKNELKEKAIDSTTVIVNSVKNFPGDPSNPKPPRN